LATRFSRLTTSFQACQRLAETRLPSPWGHAMERFSTVANDPNRSHALRIVQKWLDMWVCSVKSRQGVVHHRHDEYGRPVTQPMFDRSARPAHVCPFVADSIDRDLCWLEDRPFNDEADITDLLSDMIAEFCLAEPAFDPRPLNHAADYPYRWKTFVLVLPNVMHNAGRLPLFDTIHTQLKSDYMDAGLMLGQFYKGCPQGGIYDPTFTPLWSPYPLFAIRYMARHDHLFFDPQNRAHAAAYKTYFP
jgi:hypothetical protein